MSTNEIVALIIGVLLAEGTEIAPWLAKRLVRWSAHIRHLDPKRAEIRAEELEALIDSRPGKLFKLATAMLFTVQAGVTCGIRLSNWTRLSWRIRRELARPQPSSPLEVKVEEMIVHQGGELWIVDEAGSEKTEAALYAAITRGDKITIDLSAPNSTKFLGPPISGRQQRLNQANRQPPTD